MSTTYTPDDVETIQNLVGSLRGSQLQELDGYLRQNREGVLREAQTVARAPGIACPPAVLLTRCRAGDHRKKARTMSDESGGPLVRIDRAEAFRRLYDCKVEDLRRCGVREPDRITIAMDYAVSELQHCKNLAAGPGAIQLEDDLYKAIGFDRVTGLRYSPETRA